MSLLEIITQYSVKIGSLSEKDKAAFLMCQRCEWLKEIDYGNLKIYCLKQKCVKRGDQNF